MSENFKENAIYIKNPQYEGMYMKHFFDSNDNDRLNNVEITIIPGFGTKPHIHENSTEFFYIVSGEGEFTDDDGTCQVKKGDAFKAPKGVTHSIINTSNEVLVIFSTFSPPIR
ncbi:MAG: cupin domain-containing protein [Clostridioides sp.]|jgi:mannose-6-phosphate isomerase-like protein (cupin superfamily)|nr:cupin domain-containing protein [Clostridioides sp.]